LGGINLIGLLFSALDWFLRLLELLIFIDAAASWFVRPRSNNILRFIGTIIDPVLTPCNKLQRKLAPNSPVNFSPLIAIIAIEFVRSLILNILTKILYG
jgi:YggT family protein